MTEAITAVWPGAPQTPIEWLALSFMIAAVLILGVLPAVSFFVRDAQRAAARKAQPSTDVSAAPAAWRDTNTEEPR